MTQRNESELTALRSGKISVEDHLRKQLETSETKLSSATTRIAGMLNIIKKREKKSTQMSLSNARVKVTDIFFVFIQK